MRLYYIVYGNYYPEEFITGYFASEAVADAVCEFLNDNSDCYMHKVSSMNTDTQYNTFQEWKEEWDT